VATVSGASAGMGAAITRTLVLKGVKASCIQSKINWA
jgi:NADP-dependent 3-hydroxy acid dehydrogenase YdfG